MGDPLVELPATEQRRLLAARQISAVELLDAHLERIAAVNPAVNAVIALDAVLDGFRPTIEGLGWEVVDDEPDLRGADDCFRTLRAWQSATGTAARLGSRAAQLKSTIRDEIRRGTELTAADVALAYEHLGPGNPSPDIDVLRAAATLESASGHGLRRPPVVHR